MNAKMMIWKEVNKMPNHVRTVVKFKRLKGELDKEFILRMIAKELTPRDDMFTPDHPDHIIDFNKVIPQPREEEDCPPEYLRPEASHAEPLEDRPWFNWYKWNCERWGTKWGAYDGYTIQGKTYLTFVFSTAWSLATPIVERLRLLGYDFDVYYADEDWGCNCGKIIYNAKDSEWTHEYEEELGDRKARTSYAKRIWDRY